MRLAYSDFVKLMLAMHASQFVVHKQNLPADVKCLLSPFAVLKLSILATVQHVADESKAFSHA